MSELVRTRAELAEALAAVGAERAGLVPTMGALHSGHAALMSVARDRIGTGPMVVSVFVNPLQFGAAEDLGRYPRTLDADLAVCAEQGADVVFAPTEDEMYPAGRPQVLVDPGGLGEVLEGAVRPGHFAGVLTVVARLFNLVRPRIAVFGEKDYQQLALIRRMVTDLCFPLEIVGAPTVREPDGLAMSSRNRFLSPADRRAAGSLSRALRAGIAVADRGGTRDEVLAAARSALESIVPDYLVVTDESLAPLPPRPEPAAAPADARILVAARIGSVRLVDNMAIRVR
ncbi:MAG: pantoate--beta-alanine ligase [Nocardioides sp.]